MYVHTSNLQNLFFRADSSQKNGYLKIEDRLGYTLSPCLTWRLCVNPSNKEFILMILSGRGNLISGNWGLCGTVNVRFTLPRLLRWG